MVRLYLASILILVFCFVLPDSGLGQFDCNLQVDDLVEPKTPQVGIYSSPNLDYEIYVTKDWSNQFLKEGVPSKMLNLSDPTEDTLVRLKVIDPNVKNGMIKVEITFPHMLLGANGINPMSAFLYEILDQQYYYDESFSDFLDKINNRKQAEKLFNILSADSVWDKYNWVRTYPYDEKEVFDISTFSKFLDYFVYYDDKKPSIDVINLHHANVFVKIEDVIPRYADEMVIFSSWRDPLSYVDEMNELIAEMDFNYCKSYDDAMLQYLITISDELIATGKPFEAIALINENRVYLKSPSAQNIIDFQILKCSYEDDNYKVVCKLGEKIIQKWSSGERVFKDDYVYGYGTYKIKLQGLLSLVVYSNLREGELDSAKGYCELAISKGIDFESLLGYYTYALINLNESERLCDYLSGEYMNGNIKAKEFLNKYCNE